MTDKRSLFPPVQKDVTLLLNVLHSSNWTHFSHICDSFLELKLPFSGLDLFREPYFRTSRLTSFSLRFLPKLMHTDTQSHCLASFLFQLKSTNEISLNSIPNRDWTHAGGDYETEKLWEGNVLLIWYPSASTAVFRVWWRDGLNSCWEKKKSTPKHLKDFFPTYFWELQYTIHNTCFESILLTRDKPEAGKTTRHLNSGSKKGLGPSSSAQVIQWLVINAAMDGSASMFNFISLTFSLPSYFFTLFHFLCGAPEPCGSRK